MENAQESKKNGVEAESPEIQALGREVMALPDQARSIVVVSDETMMKADSVFGMIREMRRKIQETFDPIVKKAHAAWKEALAAKAKHEVPLAEAEKWLGDQVANYRRKQNEIYKAAQEKLRLQKIAEEAERRKKQEDEDLEKAAELEKSGANDEAQGMLSEIAQRSSEPISVPLQRPSMPAPAKAENISTREYWSAEVFDKMALFKAAMEGKVPIDYIQPNMDVLNAMAKAQKNIFSVPGVKAVSRIGGAAKGR